MPKKILITGATGKVGEALTKFFIKETNDTELILLTANPQDLKPSDKSTVISADYLDIKWIKDFIQKEKPNIVINCAAMTNVDACEDDHKLAMDLNAILPETLSKACKSINAKLIHFSTDYIFDGEDGPYTEDHQPNPISFYGKSKLAGENAIKTNLDNFLIFRTNVVFGISNYGKNDFINWLITKFENEQPLNIITGQYCNPTYVEDIAWAVLKAVEKNANGVFNLAGNTWDNRFVISELVIKEFDFDKKLLTPIPSESLKQKAKRPEKGGLINTKAEAILGIKFLTLPAALSALKFQFSEYQL